ncbi:FMN-binding domain protein [Ruminiclostridium hungatei]|uniref:FMN-binding domain protein n=1 Tax=Ruminiclostridium hungatei TaxID=48256 RepID=A0A1V4SJA2_RUMHU|nr:FMN-binding protein [Ruminiclostridium hungatei]OPX43968.1 FMN-binding domain protein [Ruminiclostridium hungatei]
MYKKVILGVVCIAVISVGILGGRYLYQTWKYKKLISEIVISSPNISKLPDGIYKGSYDAILVAADVSVTVEGNKIKEIKLDKHKNERGLKGEAITDKVIAAQSLKVDTISGATNSSKVILKAIDNALSEATDNVSQSDETVKQSDAK